MYRALYRKWRPRRFEDVVGQGPIVQALKNQVATGRIGHAFLFTGTRGTGKTTCAKILAKAVNCPNAKDGDPCGECPVCRGVDDGSLLDVVEIDAASNNGVDDVRELREEAVYTPSVGKYKVYIVDEVHMLSAAAFNALLKIMEEPPAHLIFILATTELHKVPATILSRCQRYDFMRIAPEDIAARLTYVAGEEKIDLTPGAALLLGHLADGAMRDALSLLDTCAGMGGTVDEEMVRRAAGVTEGDYLFSISRAVAAGDIPALARSLQEEKTRSLDTKRLCEELIFHYRNLMLANFSDGGELLTDVNPSDTAAYLADGKKTPVAFDARAIRRLGEALEHMTRGAGARIELELALYMLAQPEPAAVPSRAGAFDAAPAAPARPNVSAPARPNGPVPPAGNSAPAAAAVSAAAPVSAAGVALSSPPKTPAPPAAPTAAVSPVVPRSGAGGDSAAPQPERTAAPVSPAPSAAPSTAPSAAASAVPGAGPQPFAAWAQVLALVSQRDIVLSSFMNNSAAYRQGNRILIDAGTLFNDFIRTNEKSHAVLKAVLTEVTGENLGIGPYVTARAEKTGKDPLDALREMGVPVKEI